MANIAQKKIVTLPEKIRRGISAGLSRYGKVKVVGLGIFELRKIPSRLGRHPLSGDIVKFKSYYKIKFRPTKSLKEKVC